MSTKDSVLHELKSVGDFVSGQDLCDHLGLSRTAIWKAVKLLKEEGYPIEAQTNRGYRLLPSENADIFNSEEVAALLTTKWVGHPLEVRKQTGSTNLDIMALSDQGAASGTVVASCLQTAGRGRRGRTWVSPDEGNIYMSILLRPDMPPSQAPQTTLVMALSVLKACQEICSDDHLQFAIKWPNDIVVCVDGSPYRKIVGILTEMRMEEMQIRDVTVGTGINVNMKEIPEDLKESATSIALAAGHDVSRALLAASIWNHFEEDFQTFVQAGSLAPLQADYEKGLVNKNREVLVLDPRGQYKGIARGITHTGELIVEKEDGGIANVGNGEISVRGVMGAYV